MDDTAAALAQLDLNTVAVPGAPGQAGFQRQRAAGAKRRQGRGGRLQRLAAEAEANEAACPDGGGAPGQACQRPAHESAPQDSAQVPHASQSNTGVRRSRRLVPRKKTAVRAAEGAEAAAAHQALHAESPGGTGDALCVTNAADSRDGVGSVAQLRHDVAECSQVQGRGTGHSLVQEHRAAVKGGASCADRPCSDDSTLGPVEFVASSVQASRSACRLRWLNGAAPVCYGIPTIFSYHTSGSRT